MTHPNIIRARAMLMQLDQPPASTVAAILAEQGCDHEHAPAVMLSRNRFDGPSVALDAGVLGSDVAAAVWVQVATAGDYRGYAGGAFVFDAKIFAQIIRNFRANPSYRAGTSDVIPWDFNHASASFAADGSIPVSGTPAQGWIQELDARAGADGALQLWALTRWLEPARSYIRGGNYKWASVVVGFDCQDPRSGANIGACLESVALTNNPFISGMQPLIAASRGAMPPSKGNQPMSLTLSRAPDGTGRLALGKEIGPNVGGFANDGLNPPRNGLPNLDETFFQEVIGKARLVPGFLNQTPQAVAAWLRSVDPTNVLKHDDPQRCAMLVGSVLRTLALESMPVGTNAPQPTQVPIELSRQLDCRDQPGDTPTQRGIMGLGAVSPRFASLDFASKCAIAAAEIRAGRIVA